MEQPSPIAGLYLATSHLIGDARGEFARLFDSDLLNGAHGPRPIVQINRSLTRQPGSVRGLHYQTAPALEGKWVRCLHGRVHDVAVDLRLGSPTFLQHFSVELTPDKAQALFIPEGCAHGFQVLEADSELLYLHTAAYAPAHEGGLRCDDPALAIRWPLPIGGLSQRDASHPLIDRNFKGIAV
ncbi:MAG: dTDP-4-dehydrorhamnose 3,5-epimerase family protein [Novosphingobium sp.]|uniref:dTDP-4-dehydrorhamnose 3,5-epimerase family protein n=1 Tax=Novosphingobium sp. TaxID=1874826 RepID=UPI0032B9B6C2